MQATKRETDSTARGSFPVLRREPAARRGRNGARRRTIDGACRRARCRNGPDRDTPTDRGCAAASETPIDCSGCIGQPWTSTGRFAMRPELITGESKRSISSTAFSSSSGRARSFASSLGCSSSARTPLPIRSVVVTLPAISSRLHCITISSSFIESPPSVACTIALIRSCAGTARRSAIALRKHASSAAYALAAISASSALRMTLKTPGPRRSTRL